MLDKQSILLIDDDNDVLQAYQQLLELEGYQIKAINNPLEALNIIPENWNGVVLSDIYMPQLSGWDLLDQIHQKDNKLPVILITGHGDVPMAIEAVRKGAFYFIEKPIDPEKLLIQIDGALTERQRYLEHKLEQQQELDIHFIGKSQWIKHLRKYLQQLSETDVPVFIFGQIGTGKTLAANYLADLTQSRFSNKYHLDLLSDYAVNELQQVLQQLTNSILIIKNIEFLSLAAQKLLAQYIRQNDKNIRIIATSQYSLPQLLNEFNFLPELFYTFSLTQLEMLPLSHRTMDIEPLFRHYLDLICKKLRKKKPIISENLLKQLLSQQWLGNINQLIHTAELYAVGVTVQNDNLHFIQPENELSLDDLISEYEKKVLIDVLDRFNGRISEVANYLQIPRKKLYLRMKKYDLNKEDYKE